MAVAYSLIPGLDDIVKYGDSKRRADAIRKISDLFVQGAAQFQPNHVDLFDGILISLVPRTEIEARSELAERLAEVANAPPLLVRQLVRDDEAAIAGPLLRRSPLIDEPTLVEIARMKSQLHLLAISERPTLSTSITDVIVRRGDREVVRKVAGNGGANFSQAGYSGLIRRAGEDGVLALAVGQRDDLSFRIGAAHLPSTDACPECARPSELRRLPESGTRGERSQNSPQCAPPGPRRRDTRVVHHPGRGNEQGACNLCVH